MTTLTFNDLFVDGHLQLDVHFPNGTLQQRIYSNQSVTINESLGDHTIIIHPKESTILQDPISGFMNFITYNADTMINFLIVVGACIGVIWVLKGLFSK